MTEAETYARYIISSIDHLLECLDEVDTEGLNWHPNAKDTNSLFALATHAIANTAENVLGTACRLSEYQVRDHEAEFAAQGTLVSELRQYWSGIAAEIRKSLATMPREALGAPLAHPRRGEITTREVLLVAARHAAEHFGQAQLTRDLWLEWKENVQS